MFRSLAVVSFDVAGPEFSGEVVIGDVVSLNLQVVLERHSVRGLTRRCGRRGPMRFQCGDSYLIRTDSCGNRVPIPKLSVVQVVVGIGNCHEIVPRHSHTTYPRSPLHSTKGASNPPLTPEDRSLLRRVLELGELASEMGPDR